MKFENVIKKISSIVSGIVVFMIVGGFYLNSKGFEVDDKGNIVLVRDAIASEKVALTRDIPLNQAFPQDHVMGDERAPLTLYEYSSFGCFHCADFHLDVLPKVKEEYVDKGLLRIVFVPLPLDKASMDAALLAECVEKDKYFPFIDVLFKKQRDWGLDFNPQKVLIQYATLSGISSDKAMSCLKDDKMAARILQDRKSGLDNLGIEGTPSFVLSSKFANELVSGYQSFDKIKSMLDERLARIEEDEQK